MRLVKIDGINVIINMDKVVSMEWAERPDSDGEYRFDINGKTIGYFDSKEERDRVVQSIFDKFGTPGEKLYIDNEGYEVNNRELWN